MDTPETLIARLDALIAKWREREQNLCRRADASGFIFAEKLSYRADGIGQCADEAQAALRDAAHALSGATPTGKEMVQLIADHSVALDFLREIASGECPIGCGNCIICRTKAWLFTERESSVSPSSEGWQPVSQPPNHSGPHSLAVLGWHSRGGVVLAHYTPFYIRREDDMVWTAEKWSRANGRVTHWMPLPAPPASAGTEER